LFNFKVPLPVGWLAGKMAALNILTMHGAPAILVSGELFAEEGQFRETNGNPLKSKGDFPPFLAVRQPTGPVLLAAGFSWR
jgi:hypothetical protein